MPGPAPSLDRRIADCLAANTHQTEDVAALLKELEETAGSIEAERTYSSAQLIDPTQHIADIPAAKAHIDVASAMLARLETAKPRLQALLDAALAADRLAKWNADLAALQITRDALAERFRTRYTEVGVELIGIFDAMIALDKEVAELNGRAHAAGSQQRMRTTECKARGIDGFDASTKSVLTEIRLPVLGLGSGQTPMAWPRPAPPIGLQVMAGMNFGALGGGACTPEQYEERDRALAAEAKRVSDFYARQEAGREALNMAELQRRRDAFEERRRNGG
jgi:hypothetical protein